MNSRENLIALPAKHEAQQSLDRPIHDSGHGDWNTLVMEEVADINRRVDFARSETVERARQEIQALMEELRTRLEGEGRPERLT